MSTMIRVVVSNKAWMINPSCIAAWKFTRDAADGDLLWIHFTTGHSEFLSGEDALAISNALEAHWSDGGG